MTRLFAKSCCLMLLAASSAIAQTLADAPAKKTKDTPEELFRRVESMDRALFDAFNTCDLKKLESFFIPELEFYHDNDGLSPSRDKFIGDVKKNVCGKFRRELVAGTMEVYPLGDYGAMYTGTHRFCKVGASRCEGQGKFMHIWQNKAGDWKLTRVISYDHRPVPQ